MERQQLSSNDIRILSRMRMFQKLPAADLRKIADAIHFEHFAPGTNIFKSNSAGSYFVGVLSGWIIVYGHSPNGSFAVLDVLGSGETIGETALFLGDAFDAEARSVDTCRLCIFELDIMRSLMVRMPSLASGMMTSISWQLKRANDELARLQTLSGEQRLALFLLEAAEPQGNRCNISLPYNKMLIAKRLGMRPESLSRHFKHLRTFGVKVEHQNIFISDIEFLWSHLKGPLRSH